MTKRRPILSHDAGVALYAPSENFPSFRLVWKDPDTGKRPNRRYSDRPSAEAAFNQTVEYVQIRLADLGPAPLKRKGQPTVDDLFGLLVKRWGQKGCSQNYVESRQGIYRNWIQPEAGRLSIQEWAKTDDYCLDVMASAREAGRAPSTMQNIGSLMRTMVTAGWAKGLIPKSLDPMAGVEYVAPSEEQGESVRFIPSGERPTSEMVEALRAQFQAYGEDFGHDWLGLMVEVAGYAGLRLGELAALRPCDLDPTHPIVTVSGAWSHSNKNGAERKLPKSKKRRRVGLRASTMSALRDRAAVVAAQEGNTGLLFPQWQKPGTPLTDGSLRSAFKTCARRAGWKCRPDTVSPKGQHQIGTPLIPWRNLRHHTATWLHQQGMEWEDVSKVLGHASFSFTMDRYVRPGAGAEARMVDLLSGL